jgi:hypothetical protein
MAITYPTQWDAGDGKNDVPMKTVITPVPVAVDAKWSLTNFTIAATFLAAAGVAPASQAARYIPGLLEGHLYKITIVVAATDENLMVLFGDKTTIWKTMPSAATYTFYARPSDSGPFVIYTSAGSTTASITSVEIELVDPANIDLLPAEATPAQL